MNILQKIGKSFKLFSFLIYLLLFFCFYQGIAKKKKQKKMYFFFLFLLFFFFGILWGWGRGIWLPFFLARSFSFSLFELSLSLALSLSRSVCVLESVWRVCVCLLHPCYSLIFHRGLRVRFSGASSAAVVASLLFFVFVARFGSCQQVYF